MSKGFVAVQIAGQEYKIRSDSEDESLRKIAGYVDRAMKRVRDGTGTVDSLDVAVLTCLNLAREILALREKNAGARDDARLQALIEKVEAIAPSAFASSAARQADADSAPARSSEAAAGSAARSSAARAEAEPAASVRTLELPSADSLSDSSGTSAVGSVTPDGTTAQAAQAELPTQRVAAAGRDRAS